MRKVSLVKAVAFLALAVALVTLAWCNGRVQYRELSRTTSPTGAFDAVVAQPDGQFLGATLPRQVLVFLVPAGANLPPDASFAADRPMGVRLEWEGNDRLIVYADSARVYVKRSSADVATSMLSTAKVAIRYRISKETSPNASGTENVPATARD